MDPAWAAGFETQAEEARASLDVEGTIPEWLTGTYVANGPGAFEAGDRPLVHWFDPFAMLRRFRFDDGAVAYANRYVRSRDLAFAEDRGRVRTPFPGTPADRPLPVRLLQALRGTVTDNPVIGVARMGGEWLAVTESPWGLAFDPDTLETLGRRDLTAGLDADLTLGHLHHDPDEGAFYNLAAAYGGRGETGYTLFRRPAGEEGGPADPDPIARIRVDRPYLPYVHSFALTGRYAVVGLMPSGVAPRALLVGALRGRTFLDAFDGFDDPGRLLVFDRRTGERVADAPVDPAFVYHHANAYETDAGGSVALDCVAYPDERAVTDLTLANLRGADPTAPAGDLVRYRIDLDAGRADRRVLRTGPVEFPAIHYRRHNGRPYRHVWLAEGGPGPLPARLARVDVRDGGAARYDPGPAAFPGEPVFVPRPDPDGEADGVLLSVVLDAGADRSVLVVLDAGSMAELARAPLPHRLPYGFHGQFYGPPDPGRSMN
ncbi:MAG: carotenoid oxygenase family protein [Haloferacaceae archaeon]